MPANTTMKCFNPIPIENYLEFMSKKLQPKRMPRSYVHRDTNKPRKKDMECLLKDEILQAQVEKYLIQNYPLFRFCHECMGSPDDLLAPLP